MTTPKKRGFAAKLGPGLITGAADDDPSGIASYSQAGAQFRFGLAWTLLLTTPLMIGIQMLSARIGWVTGRGLAANIDRIFPRWLTLCLIGSLVVANTINIAADLSAMTEAAHLLGARHVVLWCLGFGCFSVLTQVFFSFEQTVRLLKWLTLSLFSYVAVVLSVSVPWKQFFLEGGAPWLYFPAGASINSYASMVVAVLGTTISPYLFFWQASQEVEESQRRPDTLAVRAHPAYIAEHLARIREDTVIGMIFSNLVAMCIVIATAVTLNERGIFSIQTAAQAAQALRPVAGDFAFELFALGIIATGLLAVPVLAGSAAYAVSEVFNWKSGLSNNLNEAPGFYTIIIAATLIGAAIGALEIGSIRALVWAAVINGIIAVPIMCAMLKIGQSRPLMGELTISPRHAALGWAAALVMAVAVVFMFVTR
jgi:NRAMP (natural resistance-associated macrophage protein)-like metal ion transporter